VKSKNFLKEIRLIYCFSSSKWKDHAIAVKKHFKHKDDISFSRSLPFSGQLTCKKILFLYGIITDSLKSDIYRILKYFIRVEYFLLNLFVLITSNFSLELSIYSRHRINISIKFCFRILIPLYIWCLHSIMWNIMKFNSIFVNLSFK
jgi:hypothetical protein